MRISGKKETLSLFAGDIIFFYASLWITLTVRYLEFPSEEALALHFTPFSILIAVWVVSFFIAGLYSKHTLLFRKRLPATIFKTQLVNSAVGVFFFYFIPYFTIAPKTNLFIYLGISFLLILWWRLYGIKATGARRRQKALLVGSGGEMAELENEINMNPRYPISFSSAIDLARKKDAEIVREINEAVRGGKISAIVVDLHDKKIEPMLPALYKLLFSRVRVINFYKMYEELFDRIPISVIGYRWFIENIPSSSFRMYDIGKRAMDIALSLVLGALSLIFYPLVCFAVKLDDGGPIFIRQERVGRNGKIISIVKFRTMHDADKGKWVIRDDPRITRAGKFLRISRIDELPQLWNVLSGDISLIGPRPELPDLVRLYEEKIPYYSVRHLIKPGLSGWGQIHHEKPPHSIEETKEKLSYDLYYIKNRSLFLDIEIALKTIRTLLSRSGV